MPESFVAQLTGGHPNSLGNTIAVVDAVLSAPKRMDELYACYQCEDPVVRLRTSNAMKRIAKQRIDLLVPLIDGLLNDIATIEQASTQWTLASLFDALRPHMDPTQTKRAKAIMQDNLRNWDDWIVLTTTMQVLTTWSDEHQELRAWLKPELTRLQSDSRKSVAGRATKMFKHIGC